MREPLKLEVGKYYEDRDGIVYGPIKEYADNIYPFTDGVYFIRVRRTTT